MRTEIVKELEEKIIAVAKKYADLVEKQIDTAMNTDEEVNYESIQEGIRIINHISSALWRLGACEKGSEAPVL